MFRTFDSDNSGKIDFKEFLLAINITSAGKPEQKLEWAFQMYDVNGDGTIEPSEMCEIITVNNSINVVIYTWTFHLDIPPDVFPGQFPLLHDLQFLISQLGSMIC